MFSRFPQPNVLELRRDAIVQEMRQLRRQIDSQSTIAREAFSNLRREFEETLPDSAAEVQQLLGPLFDFSTSCSVGQDSVLDLLQRTVQVTEKVLVVLEDVLKAYRQVYSTLDALAAYRDYAADLRDVVCLRVERALGDDKMAALGWKRVTWKRIKEERYAEDRGRSSIPVYDIFKDTLAELGVTVAEFQDLDSFRKLATGLFHKKKMTISESLYKIGIDQFPPELVRFTPAIKSCLKALEGCKEELAEVERSRKIMLE